VRNTASCESFACFEDGGETFLFPIATSDETWGHHFELEKKGSPWNGTILNLHGRFDA